MQMSKMYKLSFVMLLSLIFTGCASMSHNHHGSMSMSDKSCCCKSDSKSCSMGKRHDNHKKSGMPMNHDDHKVSMKNGMKMSCCNNSMGKDSESNKKDQRCSMCMKGKKDKQYKSFDELDANADGKISISEYLDNPNKEFDILDSNSDGFLTKEEIQRKESTNSHAHH